MTKHILYEPLGKREIDTQSLSDSELQAMQHWGFARVEKAKRDITEAKDLDTLKSAVLRLYDL